MKRFHVSVGVTDLDASVAFYARLFDAEPTLKKTDYARWVLDEPSVNFSINLSSAETGVSHLGVQADNAAELQEVFDRFARTEGSVSDEGETTCCYARSTKQWVSDPDGLSWEGFQTHLEDVERPQTTPSPYGCC